MVILNNKTQQIVVNVIKNALHAFKTLLIVLVVNLEFNYFLLIVNVLLGLLNIWTLIKITLKYA